MRPIANKLPSSIGPGRCSRRAQIIIVTDRRLDAAMGPYDRIPGRGRDSRSIRGNRDSEGSGRVRGPTNYRVPSPAPNYGKGRT